MPAISAANLTGIESYTKSASDPTITTNPSGGVGTMWVNSTSGEVYILTDATTNKNKWINVGGGTGDVVPWVEGASTTVYKVGGHNSGGASNSIESISVSSDGDSSDVSDMVVAGGSFSNASDTPHAYGYYAGGNQGRSNQIERYQYLSLIHI